jgi:hypothetical protein
MSETVSATGIMPEDTIIFTTHQRQPIASA